MMVISTKKRPTRYNSEQYHIAFGIQNWLCQKGYCLTGNSKYVVDKTLYKNLLKDFILSERPDFDFSKMKRGLETMERFAHNRFSKFRNYANNEYK